MIQCCGCGRGGRGGGAGVAFIAVRTLCAAAFWGGGVGGDESGGSAVRKEPNAPRGERSAGGGGLRSRVPPPGVRPHVHTYLWHIRIPHIGRTGDGT